jgi:hypothetical protein
LARKDSRKQNRPRPARPAGPHFGARLPGWLRSDGAGRWLVVALALLVVLGVTYPEPMFQGRVFLSADSSNADAFAAVGDASLAEGHYPLWNPYLFAGMPTFGSLAYAKFLYPPSVLFNFLQGTLGFAPMTWLLGHLLFGGLGMAWLLSRWRLPVAALVLGAVVWLLFPRIVAWGVHGHGTKLGAAMYLPWLVGWALRVLDGRSWRAVGMTGLLLGLQLLRGHVQITYYSLLVVGWLGLWATLFPFEEQTRQLVARVRWLRLGQLVLGLVLGFMIGGIMLLPVHEYAGISIRGQDTAGGGGVGLEYATGWSLAPSETGTFVLPAAAGFGKATYMGAMPFTDYPNYFGILLLLLAAAAWWHRARSLVLALGLMALLAVFVSFGNFGFGLYELLYNYLPFFNKFRVPSMILVVVAFALAILAARGAAAWAASLPGRSGSAGEIPFGRPVVLPAVTAGIGVLLLVLGASGAVRESYLGGLREMAAGTGKQVVDVLLQEAWYLQKSSLIRIGLLLMTAGAALWASVRNARFMGSLLVWVMVVLLAMDLGGVNKLIVHPEQGLKAVARTADGRGTLVDAGPLLREPGPAREQLQGPEAQALALAVGHDRVWPLGAQGSANTWMADGIRSLGGYHPAKLAQYEQIRKRLYDQQPAGHLANWLGGRVIAFERPFSPQDLEFLRQTGVGPVDQPVQNKAPYFYTNRAALPRARLVDDWRPVDALPEKDALAPFLDGIQGGSIAYGELVHLDRQPDPAPRKGEEPLPEPVFVTDGLDEVVLEVDSPRAALLLLADMNAPGWQVSVDGQDRQLLTADLVLRAVALDEGRHTVRFHYSDPAVSRGLALTLTGGVLVLAALLGPMIMERRNRKAGGIPVHE